MCFSLQTERTSSHLVNSRHSDKWAGAVAAKRIGGLTPMAIDADGSSCRATTTISQGSLSQDDSCPQPVCSSSQSHSVAVAQQLESAQSQACCKYPPVQMHGRTNKAQVAVAIMIARSIITILRKTHGNRSRLPRCENNIHASGGRQYRKTVGVKSRPPHALSRSSAILESGLRNRLRPINPPEPRRESHSRTRSWSSRTPKADPFSCSTP